MTILITTEQFPPLKSGISTVVSELAKALFNLGHIITIATAKHPERNPLDYPHLTLKEFNIRGGFGNFYRGETQAYLDFVLTSSYDVIINECVQTWNSDLLFPHLSKIKAIKLLHSHGFSLYQSKSKNPWAKLKALFYYHTLINYLYQYDKVMVLSQVASEIPYFQKHHFNDYDLLPNGVPPELIANEPKSLADNPLLLSISNFFPMKNQELVLRGFYLSNISARLVFIGSKQLHGYLDQLKQLKLSLDSIYGVRDVQFYTELTRDETLDYLNRATLFLHGSKLEAFPMVILEAMATGTPWICTDVGNVKELAGGLIVKSAEEMAIAINTFLDDQIFYTQTSRAGMQSVKTSYRWNTIVNHLESIILQTKKNKGL